MPWEASTIHANIGPGTSLCLTKNPQGVGDRYRLPATGDTIKIELSGGNIKSASVVAASEGEITIKLNQSTWRMTPPAQGERSANITTQGLHSTYWIIRPSA